jgi:peptidoglycan hydrolase-like protein with peptidoglycan-binding domain
VYRAGVMSTTDPKGYYACLGVEPWATADQIRAAYHRCAKLYHPDHNPSPQAKARFQAINEAYRTLGNPQQRAAYDNARRAGAPDKTDHGPVRWRRTELDPGSRALSTRKLAQVVGVGALGLALLALLFQVAVAPRGSERSPADPSLASSASATLLALQIQKSLSELALPPTQVHSASSVPPPPSLTPNTTSVPPRPAPTQNNSLSGAWLLRDLPNPKPALNLLGREEAVRLQEQLVEHGYLIGPADGVWGPRSHAALEDFRRAQGLEPDDSWTKKETHTALGSERPQEAGPPAIAPAIAEARALVQEEAVPPPRPLALHNEFDDQAVSHLPSDDGDTAPEPRPAVHAGPVGTEETIKETYVGAWARSRADCFQEADAPPLAISAQRAESFGGAQGTCEFVQVQREGAGWRTRARCSANGKSWTSHVQLKVTSSTLVWSSERGRATYYRCPPRVSATE